MPPKAIKPQAIFIADAHHSFYNPTLHDLLPYLLGLSARQIFLMGDLFDFLAKPISHSIKDNQKALLQLEQLSYQHEVFYFEGNHDFALETLQYFRHIHYFPLSKQPACFLMQNRYVFLAHGDLYQSLSYQLYSSIIRNKQVLKFFNACNGIIPLYSMLIHFLQQKHQKQKTHHTPLARIQAYQKNIPPSLLQNAYIIEGHYHTQSIQKEGNITYISLPAFTCTKNYFIVEYVNNLLSFIQKEF